MRFAGLALHDAVPDAKTIWLFREQLTRSGALATLFDRFDRLLHERGYLAMGERPRSEGARSWTPPLSKRASRA
jgi:IS5 family transposase